MTDLRKEKIYITTTGLPHAMLLAARQNHGGNAHHNQFAIYCRSTSMAKANALCEAAGLGQKPFTSAYTSVGDPAGVRELLDTANTDICIQVSPQRYITIDKLSSEAENIRNKEG